MDGSRDGSRDGSGQRTTGFVETVPASEYLRNRPGWMFSGLHGLCARLCARRSASIIYDLFTVILIWISGRGFWGKGESTRGQVARSPKVSSWDNDSAISRDLDGRKRERERAASIGHRSIVINHD
jgi:hypothetical protein